MAALPFEISGPARRESKIGVFIFGNITLDLELLDFQAVSHIGRADAQDYGLSLLQRDLVGNIGIPLRDDFNDASVRAAVAECHHAD